MYILCYNKTEPFYLPWLILNHMHYQKQKFYGNVWIGLDTNKFMRQKVLNLYLLLIRANFSYWDFHGSGIIASLEVHNKYISCGKLSTTAISILLYIGSYSMSRMKSEISQYCINFNRDTNQICNKFDKTD